MTNDLRRAFQRATRHTIHNEGAAAVAGRADGTTFYFTDSNGTIHYDRLWFRYIDGETPTQEAVAYNGGVPAQIGLPIKVLTRNNRLFATVDQFSSLLFQFTGGGWFPIAPHAPTHYRLGTDPLYIEGLAFKPFLVRPSDPLALTVYVEPGWYRYQGAQPIAWPGGNTGSLSAYVPVVDDGRIHFVIVALDRSSNTLAIIDGADVSGGGDPMFPAGATVTISDIEAITIAAAYWPLAVVELGYGHTLIRPRDITFDLRLWPGENSGLFSVDDIMTDANGSVMVDALGNVMVSS